jgi:predicted aspartyl protease
MKMCETWVTVRVHLPKGSEEVRMLADTGSLFTKVSESLARRLGVVADDVVKAKLADGSIKEVSLSEARVKRGERRGLCRF